MFAHFSLGHLTLLHAAVAGLTFLLGYLLGRSERWSELIAGLRTEPRETRPSGPGNDPRTSGSSSHSSHGPH